jgi:hypothetical protein
MVLLPWHPKYRDYRTAWLSQFIINYKKEKTMPKLCLSNYCTHNAA